MWVKSLAWIVASNSNGVFNHFRLFSLRRVSASNSKLLSHLTWTQYFQLAPQHGEIYCKPPMDNMSQHVDDWIKIAHPLKEDRTDHEFAIDFWWGLHSNAASTRIIIFIFQSRLTPATFMKMLNSISKTSSTTLQMTSTCSVCPWKIRLDWFRARVSSINHLTPQSSRSLICIAHEIFSSRLLNFSICLAYSAEELWRLICSNISSHEGLCWLEW